MIARVIGVLRTLAPLFVHLVFWSWNALFLAVTFFGLGPLVIGPLMMELIDGFVPLDFALTSAALLLIPPVCSVLAFLYLRTQPRKLFALLYGVEGPLMFLLLVRLFLVRELTAATTYVLLMLVAGGLVYAHGVFRSPRERPSRAGALAQLTSHGVVLVAGLYLAALISFYAVPAGGAIAEYVVSFRWLGDAWDVVRHIDFRAALSGMMLALMMVGLFSLTAVLFAAMPVALVVLYLGRWMAVFGRARAAVGAVLPVVITAVLVGAAVYGFVRTNTQSQRAVLARLETPPTTDAERRALLADAEQIREGLLNAYLAPYRYVSPLETDDHIAELFQKTFPLSDAEADEVQALYHLLARPLLYDGSGEHPGRQLRRERRMRGEYRDDLADERRRAATLYEAFFDEPIQKGEKDAVLRALNATYDSSGREAGLLDEGGRKVLLEKQDLTVTEHGTYATVELHEVYANQTYEQQEVLYNFSLPESAVLTGLWLGDTDDRQRRFPYVVATRGAAQAVYKAEVQRRVDPALLEQVGPRQYRLRAFPIPPRVRGNRELRDPSPTGAPERMHLWLTFQVLPADATWPLPRALERRNVYADRHTERRLNAGPLVVEDVGDWLPHSVPVRRAAQLADVAVALTATTTVRAQPLPAQRPRLAPGQRFAVVLDRSYSMGHHVAALTRAFEWLGSEIEPDHHVDLYFSGGPTRGEAALRIDQPRGFDPRDVVFFGGQDPTALLADFDRLRAGTRYDAIVVLTDAGSYALAKDAPRLGDLGGPLWFVHVGGELPVGYDDGTLELIQSSGGGVVTALPRVFASLAHARTPGFIAVDDDYLWTHAAPGADLAVADAGFAPFAARQHLVASTRRAGPLDLPTLDGLHALARRFSIVTPYSSMLVLVNDAQRAALAAAEAQADRFDREVESGTEQLSTPHGGFPVVTATPEPEEWALLVVVCGGLIAIARQRRRGFEGVGPTPCA